jgi:exopolyphosphatase / guanosine-5'-triphosphate,3'-diphosphate pyrophosphatase
MSRYTDGLFDQRTRDHETRGLEPMGVIDIGSNSVRLVVYEGAIRAPTPIFNEKVLAGLGRSVASTGRLPDDAVTRALAAMTRFRAINRILGVKNVRAIATAACREAENGPDFIRRAEAAAGVKIDILSGEREAELAAYGIMMGCHEPDGFAGDLGGGSLEIIDIANGRLNHATTLPLGGLRLIDTAGARMDQAIDIADREISKVSWLGQGHGRTFYAVGGTWRALAKMHMAATQYPLRVMHGYAMERQHVLDFCEEIRKAKKLSALPGGDSVNKSRREVLPYGAMSLERVVKRAHPSNVVFSVFGIREGLVYSLLAPREKARDPLLAFAAETARQRARSLRHAEELCDWTDAIFTGSGPKETADERRLRHAVCLMSDVGWRAHPDYRGEQTLNLVAHAALAGLDHPGRIFLALAIYFRHDGPEDDAEDKTALSERLQKIVPGKLLKRARIVGAAIRCAHMISIGRPGLIDEAPLSYSGGKLQLRLPQQHVVLDGERLRRRLDGLAKLLDCQAELIME